MVYLSLSSPLCCDCHPCVVRAAEVESFAASVRKAICETFVRLDNEWSTRAHFAGAWKPSLPCAPTLCGLPRIHPLTQPGHTCAHRRYYRHGGPSHGLAAHGGQHWRLWRRARHGQLYARAHQESQDTQQP